MTHTQTIQNRLDRFFQLIESLYNIEGIDQGEIDDMLFAYMIYNDGCDMLHEDWHGYAVVEDSPIRTFFNELNSTLVSASHAEMLWHKIMIEHDEIETISDSCKLEQWD